MNTFTTCLVWFVFIKQFSFAHASFAQRFYARTSDSTHGSNITISDCVSVTECGYQCSNDLLCRRFSFNDNQKECYISQDTLDGKVTGGDTYGQCCPVHLGYNDTMIGSKKRCVKAGQIKMTYENAQRFCLSTGAHLFIPEDAVHAASQDITVSWIDGGEKLVTTYGKPLPWTSWLDGSHPRVGKCPMLCKSPLWMATAVCDTPLIPLCQIDI